MMLATASTGAASRIRSRPAAAFDPAPTRRKPRNGLREAEESREIVRPCLQSSEDELMPADLRPPAYPRASGYAPAWLLSLNMGPNPLWLLEDLLHDVSVRKSMRVLDLGCGRGATSVFLAREFGAEVWAVDLWIDSEERGQVFQDAEVADAVHVVHADVRHLPFDEGFFDVIISIDAWEYFGTDDRLLPALLRVLRSGGQLGMATPAMRSDARQLDAIPDHIRAGVPQFVGR